MASKKSSLCEDLTCAICCDLFTDPVMLGCMHHFCKHCITTYWRGIRGTVSCPQCRQEFSNRQFQTNYLVAGMVEKVKASSSECYANHLEKQLKESLESQCSQRDDYLNMIKKDQEKMDTIKRAGADLRGRVQSDFQALRHFLNEEEVSVLEQLRKEQEQLLEETGLHLEGVQEALREVEHRVRVLQRAAVAMEQSLLTELPEFKLRPSFQVNKGPEININAFSTKYTSPLQYITWRKMFKALKPGPAALTFDVDTAHPNVFVSRDKTLAVECEERVPYTPSPKRFLQSVNVLAAQGFQSDRHYWEIGLEGKPKWDVGVALEGVDRLTRVKLCPENGYWTLRLRNGSELWAGTQPWTRLQAGAPPRRVGVFLDCEERRVSFYNADDMLLLHSFSNGPRGKAFPFFSPCLSGQSQRARPITLLHVSPVASAV